MKIAQFDPTKLSEDNPLYSREDVLLQIIDLIPQALEEILSREQENISEILRFKETGKNATDLEAQLRERAFFSEESIAEYSDARCIDDFITSYRKDGRNFFRKLAELTLTKYAKLANLKVHEVEKRRYITVLGYSRVNGHLEERSRALIPVSQFGRVPKLSAHLEHRFKETGRAMCYADLIYSHHTEEFDEEGFILDEKRERQTLIQVGEAVMFVRRIPEEEKEKKIKKLIRELANQTIYGENYTGKRNFGGIKRDIEFLMDVGEEGKYPELYEALFDTVARTVSVDDLIHNYVEKKELNGFYRTSALENTNVLEVFKKLNNLMLKRQQFPYVVA